jgi:hypothetical protein
MPIFDGIIAAGYVENGDNLQTIKRNATKKKMTYGL